MFLLVEGSGKRWRINILEKNVWEKELLGCKRKGKSKAKIAPRNSVPGHYICTYLLPGSYCIFISSSCFALDLPCWIAWNLQCMNRKNKEELGKKECCKNCLTICSVLHDLMTILLDHSTFICIFS